MYKHDRDKNYDTREMPRTVPKKLRLREPIFVIDSDVNKILGCFSNINGAFAVTLKIEAFASKVANETGHSIVIARGTSYF